MLTALHSPQTPLLCSLLLSNAQYPNLLPKLFHFTSRWFTFCMWALPELPRSLGWEVWPGPRQHRAAWLQSPPLGEGKSTVTQTSLLPLQVFRRILQLRQFGMFDSTLFSGNFCLALIPCALQKPNYMTSPDSPLPIVAGEAQTDAVSYWSMNVLPATKTASPCVFCHSL